MVTILPIDVDEELVREGLQQAVAMRVEYAVKALTEQAAELRASGIVERAKWDAAFAALAELQAVATPILEYAKAFDDQWPEEGEDADATD